MRRDNVRLWGVAGVALVLLTALWAGAQAPGAGADEPVVFQWAPILPTGEFGITVNVAIGAFIRELQRALIDRGYDLGIGGADGVYGPKTSAALYAFQRDHPGLLEADRLDWLDRPVAGRATYEALGLVVREVGCWPYVTAWVGECEKHLGDVSAGD